MDSLSLRIVLTELEMVCLIGFSAEGDPSELALKDTDLLSLELPLQDLTEAVCIKVDFWGIDLSI